VPNSPALGERLTEVLEKIPARLKVIRHVRPRYACRACEAVFQAPGPELPIVRRKRRMQRFKSPGQARRFLSSHAMIYGHFRPRRHLMSAAQYRCARTNAFRVWRQETCLQAGV